MCSNSLPDLSTPVVIPAGATYSFYITIANRTLGTNLGVGAAGSNVFAAYEYLDVSDGYSLAYPFGPYHTQLTSVGVVCALHQ